MARPQRNNVDYFPFLCEEGEKMFYLEETYGNDGFATFIKLLRELAKVDYHYLNLSKPSSMMFLSAKCKVSKEVLEAIIKDLVMLEKFDSVLWNDNKIIWCQDFINSIQDAYIKRSNKCIDYKSLLILLDSLGVRKLAKGSSKPPKSTSIDTVNPQSKVEDRIEEDNKEDETPPQPPKGDDIDFDILLKTINQIFGRKFEIVSKEVKQKYKLLLKQGYRKSNILQAMKSCKIDPLHIEQNYKYCTLEYFSRPKVIDMHGTLPTVINPAQFKGATSSETNDPNRD